MNILIVGCGKVGSMLASELDRMGHDVAVLDREEAHFALLDSDFSGYTISGVPIDQDVLKRAGIEGCDAILAMTEDDNVNIMVCKWLRKFFTPRRCWPVFLTQNGKRFSPPLISVPSALPTLR